MKLPTTLTRWALGAHTANDTPANSLDFHHVRAQLFVRLVVRALAQQVKVEVRKHGRKSVGVFKLKLIAFPIIGTKPIWEYLRFVRKHSLEKAVGVDALSRNGFRFTQDPQSFGSRQEGTNGYSRFLFPLHHMRAENVERVRVFGIQNRLEFIQWRGGLS